MSVLKNFFSNLLNWIILILSTPFIVLGGIGLILYVPIDYIIYKHSFYYKYTKEKYTPYMGTTFEVKKYNLIKSLNLPIEFIKHSSGNGGFFYYNDLLILFNNHDVFWDKKGVADVFDVYCSKEKNEAYHCSVYTEELEAVIREFEELKGKNACAKFIVLINKEELKDDEDCLSKAEKCDFIMLYDGKQNVGRRLRELVQNY